ncbi:MAG TPA: FAD-binding protein [Caulobacteraceae bacterium]|jgi:FAD/FMN-containing dehydrogenase|nr:FAD-binding protein [Caulobacteraceae bacterium]
MPQPSRRALLAGLAAAPALAAPALAAWPAAALAGRHGRVRPGQPGWPSEADWSALNGAVGGRLKPVALPDLADPAVRGLVDNPFWLGDQAGLTESSGYADAWRSAPSAYALRAGGAGDVAAAVRFAAARRLRLVVKGGGHSYLGGSNAPDSLLVWTRGLDAIESHEAFTPLGGSGPGVPAVSVGSGNVWLHAYHAVTTAGGRYVQGGGCTSVGVAGLVQGGGFGSYSKRYGLAAASLLEAQIVTADGRVRIVNAHREPDLFWALKGGGGGTFGVVTRLTLRTHELPATFGAFRWKVQAKSDAAFQRLLARFVRLYAETLCNPHWGEQVGAQRDNSLEVNMVFQGLGAAQARAAWSELESFVKASPGDYAAPVAPLALDLPARQFWNGDFLAKVGAATLDKRADARPGDFWWTGDGEQAGAFWHGYASVWLPSSLLKGDGPDRLAAAWFAASRHAGVGFHFNKGLYGADPETLAASADTSMNPQVLDAFALAITGAAGPSAFPGFPAPDLAFARSRGEQVALADAALRQAIPNGGAYVSECDYHLKGWQDACWGVHYPRLAAIKRRYDPDGLFTVHHGVGSEGWSADGFTRT